MKIRSALKKSSFLLFVLTGFIVGVGVYAGAEQISSRNDIKAVIPQQEKVESHLNFPKNELGETYGSAKDVLPNEKDPDLMEAMGVNGNIGYVRAKDLKGEEPKTIEEALAQNNSKPREINVYKSDGKTVIDKFIVGNLQDENRYGETIDPSK
jgi:hypothetical protein